MPQAASGAGVFFPAQFHANGCTPDFDNPISTIAVWDKERVGRVCVRNVEAATLAEVFDYYKDDFEFTHLYEVWKDGNVVHHKKHARGKSAGWKCKAWKNRWKKSSKEETAEKWKSSKTKRWW